LSLVLLLCLSSFLSIYVVILFFPLFKPLPSLFVSFFSCHSHVFFRFTFISSVFYSFASQFLSSFYLSSFSLSLSFYCFFSLCLYSFLFLPPSSYNLFLFPDVLSVEISRCV
jgi:hypothetical protein